MNPKLRFCRRTRFNIFNECEREYTLRKAKGGTRVATVIDSPYIPELKEYFMITKKGIEDTPSAD